MEANHLKRLKELEAELSFPARAVVEALNQLKEEIGAPKYIRCYSGPEFLSKTFTHWCEKNFIEIKYIKPGKPMQNGYIERFDRYYREDVRDTYYFEDFYQLQKLSNHWKQYYNNNHLHKCLGNKPPAEFMPRFGDEINLISKPDLDNKFLSN